MQLRVATFTLPVRRLASPFAAQDSLDGLQEDRETEQEVSIFQREEVVLQFLRGVGAEGSAACVVMLKIAQRSSLYTVASNSRNARMAPSS
jgi:hypothetical protein